MNATGKAYVQLNRVLIRKKTIKKALDFIFKHEVLSTQSDAIILSNFQLL